ncbi:hypothetical protein UlMin_035875 [Ulmus minor]
MKPYPLVFFLLHLLLPLSPASPDHDAGDLTSIVFTTLGRLEYAFDIYTLRIFHDQSTSPVGEIRITDGQSVNFNGHFPSPSSTSSLLRLLPNETLVKTLTRPDSSPLQLVYVTERDGVSNIYYDVVFEADRDQKISSRRSAMEVVDRVQVPLLSTNLVKNKVSMKDRPSVAGDYLVYVSTHENTNVPRTSWAAVYSTEFKSGVTRRLTPYGVADFSPAVSPSGKLTAVASYGGKGWDGEVEELSTDIYIFSTGDGSRRVKVVQHGGWPSWADESTIYFHRRGEDQWWSIYRAILPSYGEITTDSVVIERVTPPGIHAFTPAASPENKNLIALATRRPNSSFRHIELFYLDKNEFKELTRLVSPQTHHINPFISSDGSRVGYHKCRGNSNNGGRSSDLLLENIESPVSSISLFRTNGSFPTFSPAGDRLAYSDFPGISVVNIDGTNLRHVYDDLAFSTVWDKVRNDVVYAAGGPDFAPESAKVDILSINVDQLTVKKLTTNGNNAFPSPSPDGKQIVFRSGRTGHKNLYIIDAVDGEEGGLQRLTNGPWTDTMCSWSPDGDWIAFASDRDDPGSGSFALYLIHPNGTGLRRLVHSGLGGRTNHPFFSPDGKRLTFTSDYTGISAEPISNPHQYQPYGEIFTIKLDGSDLTRLTHNSYEDGTPVWAPKYIRPSNVELQVGGAKSSCRFEDLHWLNKMPSYVEELGLNKLCGAGF